MGITSFTLYGIKSVIRRLGAATNVGSERECSLSRRRSLVKRQEGNVSGRSGSATPIAG
jgi:hypothetical protein